MPFLSQGHIERVLSLEPGPLSHSHSAAMFKTLITSNQFLDYHLFSILVCPSHYKRDLIMSLWHLLTSISSVRCPQDKIYTFELSLMTLYIPNLAIQSILCSSFPKIYHLLVQVIVCIVPFICNTFHNLFDTQTPTHLKPSLNITISNRDWGQFHNIKVPSLTKPSVTWRGS